MHLFKKLISCPTRVHDDEFHEDATLQTKAMHTYRVFVMRVFIVVRSQFSIQGLQLADVIKEQTLVASWANAAKPSPIRHYVPVCVSKGKKLIPIYICKCSD